MYFTESSFCAVYTKIIILLYYISFVPAHPYILYILVNSFLPLSANQSVAQKTHVSQFLVWYKNRFSVQTFYFVVYYNKI